MRNKNRAYQEMSGIDKNPLSEENKCFKLWTNSFFLQHLPAL
jgi:hypothetical protein